MKKNVLSVVLGVGLLASSASFAAEPNWDAADAACAPGCAEVGPDGYPTYVGERYGCITGKLVAATPREKLTPKLRREFAARYGVRYVGVHKEKKTVR
ncbi:hypothetical protein [Phenylobacterium sp.]|uniref:hypothetical protein n=1 Tax=Phenylobacterium sp. TaxID=1871053 RepID=UPI0027311C83|nr:hypothetical protein [Phenylobacterium sp.]MDP1874903.1 hypothetical protein [Phenylobacterium sp.]MDP3298589.1 hypothetical protein [Phenylobacterium sp.]